MANALHTDGIILLGKLYDFVDYLPYSGPYKRGEGVTILNDYGHPCAELPYAWVQGSCSTPIRPAQTCMKPSASVSVNVVIPVYKPELTAYERISLTQCLRILGNYPILLAAPHSLDVSAYRELVPDLQVRTFDDGYFKGIEGYNRLTLSGGIL